MDFMCVVVIGDITGVESSSARADWRFIVPLLILGRKAFGPAVGIQLRDLRGYAPSSTTWRVDVEYICKCVSVE